MGSRLVFAVMLAWVLAAPSEVPAQIPELSGAGTTVTITLPVNLTQLSPDLERVGFRCRIVTEAASGLNLPESWWYQDEGPVFGGQLVTTMKVMMVIPVEWLKDPIGKTGEWWCSLMGFSKSLRRWDFFSETSSVPAFLLKGLPAEIKGTFVW